MALLYRFVRIQDRANTHVFTFIVTRSVTRDPERDVTSKEFACGYQKWAITFSRTDKVLGVYLVWRSCTEGMRIYADFTFTILNREHFSMNESFSGKQIKFTFDSPAQGNRNYIPVNDLYARNFTDINGEFQIELIVSNVRAIFETYFRLPLSIFGGLAAGYHAEPEPEPDSASTTCELDKSAQKLESGFFTYGGYDWSIAIYPGLETSDGEPKTSVMLNRLTGFDNQCRVRYNVNLGEGEKLLDSGLLEIISNVDGKSIGWHPRVKFSDLAKKGVCRARVEMLMANTLSEVTFSFKLGVMTSRGLVGEPIIGSPGIAQVYDRDKQGWTLKTDCHSDNVRLHMVYKDVHNVPRNHLRYICWIVNIVHHNRKTGRVETIPLPTAPFSHYYEQEETDDGMIIETTAAIKELKEAVMSSLPEKSQLRIQIEWVSSYCLFQANYHKYDDVTRTHVFQMRREISTLQQENYSLERQLFSYQKSIAYAHSRRSYSEEQGTPEGRDEEYLPYYKERNFSIGDRSLSTDTDYV